MTVEEFFESHFGGYVKCADGTCYSIRTGDWSYSDDYSVEVACLPEKRLAECSVDEGGFGSVAPSHVVYGYVPLDVFEEVVAGHGGIVGKATHEEMWGVQPCIIKHRYDILWDSVRPELCSMSDLQDVSCDRYSNDG